jgi:hypothetical protein
MDGTIENIGTIESIIAPLLGIKPWSVRLGRDKFGLSRQMERKTGLSKTPTLKIN